MPFNTKTEDLTPQHPTHSANNVTILQIPLNWGLFENHNRHQSDLLETNKKTAGSVGQLYLKTSALPALEPGHQ